MLEAFDAPLFIGLITLLSLIYLWLGYKASGPIEDHEEYLLSGRSLGSFALTMTIVATQLGGGTLLGSAEEAYKTGWLVLFYPLGSCLGLLFLASGFGAKMRAYRFSTVAELFETLYKSVALRRWSSFLSISSLFIILVAQGIAARKFLYSLGCYSDAIYLAGWLVLVSYTVAGGLTAVVQTDIVQTLFIVVSCVLLLFWLPGEGLCSFSSCQALSWEDPSWQSVPWSRWLLMPFCFMLIEQDMGQRLFAAKKSSTIRKACLFSCAILLTVTAIPISVGVLGSSLGIVEIEGRSILLTIVNQISSPVANTLFACAILMAIMSTADSLLCSIVSNLVFDFPLGKGKSPSQKLFLAKTATFVTGIGAILLSYMFEDLLQVLLFAYEISVAILFVPVLSAILAPEQIRPVEAWSSCSLSALVYFSSLLASSLGGAFWLAPYGVWLAIGSGTVALLTLRLVQGIGQKLPKQDL